MKRFDRFAAGCLLVGAVCGAMAGNWLLAGLDVALCVGILMLEG